jgi:hypothetical protein
MPAWLVKASRATDNKNISSAARKFLICLGGTTLRATDEPCFFCAIRAIMRRAMLCLTPILEFSNWNATKPAGLAESRRQVSSRASSLRKIRSGDPQEIPDGLGINPRRSPALSGISPRKSPGSSGIRRGSRTLSPLDLGIRSKNGFVGQTGRQEILTDAGSCRCDGQSREDAERVSRGTRVEHNSLLIHCYFPGPTRFPQCPCGFAIQRKNSLFFSLLNSLI